MPKMVETFLPLSSIKTLFADQYKHIIEPAMLHSETCLSNPDLRQAVIYCPPGSGKTTIIKTLFSDDIYDKKHIALSATTNKAVSVIQNMFITSQILNYRR